MQFYGSLIKEQGVTFAIVVVKSSLLNSSEKEKKKNVDKFSTFFPPHVPLILMAQDSSSDTPSYYGRKDIVEFLANIDVNRIPFQKYTVT